MRTLFKTLTALSALLAATVPALAQRAADEYYDPEAMEAAREQARQEMGGQTNYFVQADRFEYQPNRGSDRLLWEGQGWIGTDFNRLWVKTEGEHLSGTGELEEAELQALYSRPISGFFDVQAGVRQDFVPGARRTFGVIGIQGLAPYLFEIDSALFVSHDGDVSARVEVEYEFLFTQRLILQPRAELNFAIQNVPELAIGSGLSTSEMGVRLRYELKREIAPYLGVTWERAIGKTADFMRAAGDQPSRPGIVAGLRLWF